MSQQTFSRNSRQPTRAALLAVGVTLGMLFSVNMIATHEASQAQIALASAANSQVVSQATAASQS